MATSSVLEHRANYYYVRLREEFILICQNGSVSAQCKALILDILEQWVNDKKGKGQSLYVYLTYPQWSARMYGMYARSVIIQALAELEDEGLISRKEHTLLNGKDTYAYTLNIQKVQSLLKALPCRSAEEEQPSDHAFKNKRVQNKTRSEINAKDGSGVQNKTRDAFKNRRQVNTYSVDTDNVNTPSAAAPASSQSGEPSSSEQSTSQEKKPLADQVLDEWDKQNGFPSDRSEYNTKAMAAYVAALITQRKMCLADMARLIALCEELDYVKKQGLTPATFRAQLQAQLKRLHKQPTQASTPSQQEQPRTHDSYGNTASAGKSPLDFILNSAQKSEPVLTH